jgi:hypothetical protein
MSSASDVLMYVDPGDATTMETFNQRLAQDARFEAHPYRVDTSDWSGPNIFGGHVWAFGADHLPADIVQDAIEDTQWRHPQRVVALVNWVDGDGPCETVVCRPRFEYDDDPPFGYYGGYEVRQVRS